MVNTSDAKQMPPRSNGPLGLRESFGLFVVAATVGFIIDAGVVTALVRGLAWGPWEGRFVSFPLAVTATWWLNRRYAFRGTGGRDRRIEYAAYWAIQLAGAAANFGIYGLCLHAVPVLAGFPFVPVAIGGLAAMFFNFAVARSTVYRAVRAR